MSDKLLLIVLVIICYAVSAYGGVNHILYLNALGMTLGLLFAFILGLSIGE